MARRSDHTKAELQSLILNGASLHLAKMGAACFSARQVAADIGYTVRTLYNVYGSHENLLMAVHAQTLSDCHAAIASALNQTPRNRLHVWAESLIDFATTHRNRWLALQSQDMPAGSPQPEPYRSAWRALHAQLNAELEPLMDGPRARQPHLALTIWAGLTGFLQFSLNGGLAQAVDDPKRLARDLIDTQLRGLKYAPPGFGRGR